MEYGAIDLHKKESQVRIVTARGEVLDQRISTTRERLTAVFGGRRPMRILLEASTESEWVAQQPRDDRPRCDRRRSDVRPHVQ
jgi:transposase